MTQQYAALVCMVGLAAGLAGCQQPAPSDMTFQRGAQLLAAGNPKSAIPFLTQTIASTPDGPEPVDLLALAYALDLQSDRAIAQARQARGRADAAPGWGSVAVGIAEMTRGRPAEAAANLKLAAAGNGVDSSLGQAARQWLALAQVLQGEDEQAIESLQSLAESDPMRTSAMLWSVLIHAQHGRTEPASQALAQCAGAIRSAGGAAPGENLSGQALYDSAVAVTAAGDLETAQKRFLALREQGGDVGDVPVWIALIAAARGEWPEARRMLKEASLGGPSKSRGLANQLFSVVCAMEDRPDAMIEHMLAGQRVLGRHPIPAYIVEQPKPESVWFSDHMK